VQDSIDLLIQFKLYQYNTVKQITFFFSVAYTERATHISVYDKFGLFLWLSIWVRSNLVHLLVIMVVFIFGVSTDGPRHCLSFRCAMERGLHGELLTLSKILCQWSRHDPSIRGNHVSLTSTACLNRRIDYR
jgi:hypothetical protein